MHWQTTRETSQLQVCISKGGRTAVCFNLNRTQVCGTQLVAGDSGLFVGKSGLVLCNTQNTLAADTDEHRSHKCHLGSSQLLHMPGVDSSHV